MELEKLASLFESVRVAPLRPEDLLVFRTMEKLDLLAMAQMHEYLETMTGGHPRILILTDGGDLAIIRPEPEPAAAIAPKSPGPELLPNGEPKRGTAPGAIA